jgi:hypothetical protein
MSSYCTIDDAKSALQATASTDDDKLFALIRAVSRRVDGLLASRYPYFLPVKVERTIHVRARLVDSAARTLQLPAPLLALDSVEHNGTALTAVQVFGSQPYWDLQLKSAAGGDWYSVGGFDADNPIPIVEVTGTWGWNSDYDAAWRSADALAAAITTTTATTFTVADIDGDDECGEAPRIGRGHLVRIDSEVMEIVGTNATTNTATVRRGVLGTAAAAHSNGAAVQVFQVEPDVRRVVARQAALLYARRGAFEASVIAESGATATYPADLLSELKGTLNAYGTYRFE